jgi:hypothetical protein
VPVNLNQDPIEYSEPTMSVKLVEELLEFLLSLLILERQ